MTIRMCAQVYVHHTHATTTPYGGWKSMSGSQLSPPTVVQKLMLGP